jgi:hypothetical protein
MKENNINNIFIYRTKNKIYNSRLGNFYVVQFSNKEHDSSLIKKGFIKSDCKDIFYFTGIFDGLFTDWSSGTKNTIKIKNKNDLKKMEKNYNMLKNSKHNVVSEIFCDK